jgi:hypothetical protein
MLSALFDMEQETNHVLITTGGNEVELVRDEALLKSLLALWQELGIQDIEANN